MENIWFFSEFFYVWLSYLCKSLRIIFLVWPTRLVVLAMGEVLSFGFNLAVSFPSDSRGRKARIVLLPSRITRWGFHHIAWIYPSTSCQLAYGITLFLLNTLDACRIAVDEWSNSSRCRIVSIYLSRTWCLYTWSCLDILITMLNSVNCSIVICSPTVEYLYSWEKPLVKPMAPGSILIISIYITLFTCFVFSLPLLLLCIYLSKIPKILSLSDLTLVSNREGIDNP